MPGSAEGVQWLRVDPQGETLTRAHVWQPERVWILQLEASHEAAAQLEAVAALAALPSPSHAAVAALAACLASDSMFCRWVWCRVGWSEWGSLALHCGVALERPDGALATRGVM